MQVEIEPGEGGLSGPNLRIQSTMGMSYYDTCSAHAYLGMVDPGVDHGSSQPNEPVVDGCACVFYL